MNFGMPRSPESEAAASKKLTQLFESKKRFFKKVTNNQKQLINAIRESCKENFAFVGEKSSSFDYVNFVSICDPVFVVSLYSPQIKVEEQDLQRRSDELQQVASPYQVNWHNKNSHYEFILLGRIYIEDDLEELWNFIEKMGSDYNNYVRRWIYQDINELNIENAYTDDRLAEMIMNGIKSMGFSNIKSREERGQMMALYAITIDSDSNGDKYSTFPITVTIKNMVVVFKLVVSFYQKAAVFNDNHMPKLAQLINTINARVTHGAFKWSSEKKQVAFEISMNCNGHSEAEIQDRPQFITSTLIHYYSCYASAFLEVYENSRREIPEILDLCIEDDNKTYGKFNLEETDETNRLTVENIQYQIEHCYYADKDFLTKLIPELTSYFYEKANFDDTTRTISLQYLPAEKLENALNNSYNMGFDRIFKDFCQLCYENHIVWNRTPFELFYMADSRLKVHPSENLTQYFCIGEMNRDDFFNTCSRDFTKYLATLIMKTSELEPMEEIGTMYLDNEDFVVYNNYCFRELIRQEDLTKFRELQCVQNPYVLSPVGIIKNDNSYVAVCESTSNKNLRNEQALIEILDKIQVLKQVASGLHEFSSHCVHDVILNYENVYLNRTDTGFEAKIRTVFFTDDLFFRAPEHFQGKTDKKSMVYSFGILALFLYFPGLFEQYTLNMTNVKTAGGDLSDCCPYIDINDEISVLVSTCVRRNPKERPTIRNIRKKLNEISYK